MSDDEPTPEQVEAVLDEEIPVSRRALYQALEALGASLGHLTALDTADMHRNRLTERVDSPLSNQVHEAFHAIAEVRRQDKDRITQEINETLKSIQQHNAEADELLNLIRDKTH